MSTVAGTGLRAASVSSAGAETALGQERGMDAVRELAQLFERDGELLLRLRDRGPQRRPRSSAVSARPSPNESASRRCCAPSCRFRSRRRRSSSAASTIRARDARSSSTVARSSAWSRSFSSAIPAAAPAACTSSRLVVERRVVDDRRNPPTAAIDPRDRAPRIVVRQLDRPTVDVDVARRLRQPVGDLERVVAERTRQALAQAGPAPAPDRARRPGRRHPNRASRLRSSPARKPSGTQPNAAIWK